MNSTTPDSTPVEVSRAAHSLNAGSPGRAKRVVWALAAGWCVAICFLLVWNYREEKRQLLELARTEARASYEKDLLFRRWATEHGGVYVPPTERTPPNPYLSHVPERDVVTTTGKALTLINPAYMTRQVYELAQSQYGVRGHITSLNPLRPENGPDPWERAALQAFARGVPEVSTIASMGDADFLRLMRPMRVEQGCLPCHGEQGYKVGDIRGGLSVSVPMAPYWDTMRRHLWATSLLFGGIGAIGLLGFFFGYRLLEKENRARNLAEKAREDSARQFRELADHNVFPVVVTSVANGRILFANRRASELLDLGSATAVGRVATDFWIEAENRPAFVEKIKAGLDVVKTVVAVRTERGRQIWVELSASRVEFQGEPAAFSILSDVTERRQTEIERQEALGRIREQAALLNCTRDAIVVVDLEGVVQFWNRGAEGIYGWLAEEAVGRALFSLVYDDERPPPVNIRRTILEQGEWDGELVQRSKAGATIKARARGFLLRNPDGTARSLLLTAADITETKQLEAQYLRAQRLESIGALASGVAHDLNNVLSPILMSIELLRPLAVTPDDREVLRLIHDSARRGADVVRQLLLFGRGSDAPSEAINVGQVLQEVLQMLRETFPRSIAVGSEIADDLWEVRCFGTQVYQILLNLCVNARDAMPSGGRLTLAARNFTADQAFVRLNPEARLGRYVELAVIDTGTGIPPEIRERIFDPFFTTKGQGKGTGLGLCTVVGIVKGQEGFMTVASQMGAGSEFRVFLPAVASGPMRTEPVAAGAVRGSGETFLLIEDEASIRHVVARTLSDNGFKVLVAANGDEGLITARQHAGDLRVAIVDMMMPGIQGAALVHELRKLVPALPIIVCSGLDRYQEELTAQGLTAIRFLPKPFVVEQLWEVLRDVLD